MNFFRVFCGAFASFAFGCSMAFAQTTPVGLWRNIDDHTGEVIGRNILNRDREIHEISNLSHVARGGLLYK